MEIEDVFEKGGCFYVQGELYVEESRTESDKQYRKSHRINDYEDDTANHKPRIDIFI
jgi:hypothetical protein